MVIMRLFPLFLHPLIARLLPPYWRIRAIKARIVAIVPPMIRDRRRLQSASDESSEKPEDVIQWMMELAKGEESDAENIATRYIYAVLGSLFSVSGAIKDTLYEICARPEYVASLREEIGAVLAEDGGWKKGTPGKLPKLDSFMREVQRVNPPSARMFFLALCPLILCLYPCPKKKIPTPLSSCTNVAFSQADDLSHQNTVGFKRVVLTPLTLSDGLHLPRNTYVCVPTTSHLDTDIASPGSFDGYRYLPSSSEPLSHRPQHFTTTSPSHLHFGHGRYACPGRYFASAEIKAVVARIVMGWDMKFPEKQGGRPRNLTILEISYQDPEARVMVKERGRERG